MHKLHNLEAGSVEGGSSTYASPDQRAQVSFSQEEARQIARNPHGYVDEQRSQVEQQVIGQKITAVAQTLTAGAMAGAGMSAAGALLNAWAQSPEVTPRDQKRFFAPFQNEPRMVPCEASAVLVSLPRPRRCSGPIPWRLAPVWSALTWCAASEQSSMASKLRKKPFVMSHPEHWGRWPPCRCAWRTQRLPPGSLGTASLMA